MILEINKSCHVTLKVDYKEKLNEFFDEVNMNILKSHTKILRNERISLLSRLNWSMDYNFRIPITNINL